MPGHEGIWALMRKKIGDLKSDVERPRKRKYHEFEELKVHQNKILSPIRCL